MKVTALRAGRSKNVPLSAAVYGSASDETIDIHMFMFVIETAGTRIVVDTGTLSAEYVRQHHAYDFVRTSSETPESALRSAGIEPDDVDYVVNTHLHWDHCSNNFLFRNARILVSRRELEYAIAPLPVHARAYEKLPGLQAPWMSAWDRTEAITGQQAICPGVTIVPLPGHTPGSQGVLLATESARYLLAGDAIGVYENWHAPNWRESIAPTIHTSLIECYETFEFVSDLQCEVIPSHDHRIAESALFETATSTPAGEAARV
ncbi:N-acyl homoserine lactonase family protein [Amycolatopsis jejuensis]|uniref:N-acyl homoserine lactonase family protein n=1 Tax=Amycolatopsis jejuensis TaxID=330084 RepID=UPI000691CF67|nr:N-acyl homoserine lactonase family protein [Amycolatopsis jejuensis]